DSIVCDCCQVADCVAKVIEPLGGTDFSGLDSRHAAIVITAIPVEQNLTNKTIAGAKSISAHTAGQQLPLHRRCAPSSIPFCHRRNCRVGSRTCNGPGSGS